MAITEKGGSIQSAENEKEIQFSFKRISNRKFEQAMACLEDSAKDDSLSRQQKFEKRDEAFCILIENGQQLLEEATRKDVQEIITAAIRFNQVDERDEKKSD